MKKVECYFISSICVKYNLWPVLLSHLRSKEFTRVYFDINMWSGIYHDIMIPDYRDVPDHTTFDAKAALYIIINSISIMCFNYEVLF